MVLKHSIINNHKCSTYKWLLIFETEADDEWTPSLMKSAHRLRAAPTKTADTGSLLSLHLLLPFTAGHGARAASLAGVADLIEGQTAWIRL